MNTFWTNEQQKLNSSPLIYLFDLFIFDILMYLFNPVNNTTTTTALSATLAILDTLRGTGRRD